MTTKLERKMIIPGRHIGRTTKATYRYHNSALFSGCGTKKIR
jgi:hypothetical protein